MQYIDCYINPITRLVTYPANTTIVQKDTNVEVLRFHFSLEAEHELEDDSIRVMVLKGNETIGFNAENVRIETNDGGDEELVFEHTITTFETAEPGQVAVSICGNQVSGNVITEAWHTLNMTFQVSGAAHSDSDEGEDSPTTAASNAEKIAALQTLVNAVVSGRPIPVDLKSKMVDTDTIYLYIGNETGEHTNYWYYHNGTQFVPGAEYGSMTIDDTLSVTGAAADAKAVGDAIADLTERGDGLTADVKAALLAAFNHVAWDDDDPTGQSYISALQTALYPPANLSSISAVYTQPGTVYDTATLNSLKANLVVTAHYSDSTTETVTNYTLSGTLAEGTSTITVSYGGKTTTFTVIVTEYEPVTETISWSGSGTDKTSSLIDATQMTAYLTIPFESEASQLVEGATAESQGMKIRTYVYSDSAAQNLVGYYYIDTNEIEATGRTTANSPWCPFDTEMVAVPQGYYGTVKISRQGTSVFADNSSCGTYLNAYATSVEMR